MEICISLDRIEDDFIKNFATNLDLLNNIHSSIVTSLYDKPTDILPKYKKITKCNIGQECSICLEQFKENQFVRTLNCKHVYHKKCIDKWINKYKKFHCPTCRKNPFMIQDH